MSTSANVQSLESIEAVRRALALFDEQVSNALTELSAEMRRLLDWLEHDRPRHWKTQVRIETDRVHEAQQALNRCLMFPIANERPSCYEERAELKKAQARLEYAREKQERVRHWQQSVQHELFEYEGRISQLVRLIDADLPQAMSVLARIIRHLEDYQSLRAGNPSTAYSDIAMARDIWSEDSAKKEPLPSSDEPATENAGGRNDLPVSTRIESEP
jgi:exonuclease VII large subunit